MFRLTKHPSGSQEFKLSRFESLRANSVGEVLYVLCVYWRKYLEVPKVSLKIKFEIKSGSEPCALFLLVYLV